MAVCCFDDFVDVGFKYVSTAKFVIPMKSYQF